MAKTNGIIIRKPMMELRINFGLFISSIHPTAFPAQKQLSNGRVNGVSP